MCLGSLQKKSFFSFLLLLNPSCTRENNHIPKREQLVCLAFIVVPPCYLLNRSLCDGKDFLNTHTHRHSIYGATHGWELPVQRGEAGQPSPWGAHPRAQAIIVNDKVTIEVIIVLN